MLIRRMTLEDVPAVVRIEQECFSQPWSEQSFRDSLIREDTIFLVCEILESDINSMPMDTESEGLLDKQTKKAVTIAGYIGMYLSFDEASITNVAVSPTYRKRGIGEQLVDKAKQSAGSGGAKQMLLEVRVSNAPAISLYKKQDFAELGIRKKFYEHPVEDAYIMSCDLAAVE